MTGSIDQSLYHTLTGSYAVPGIARVARKLEMVTDRQTDRLTDRLTDRQTHRLTDRQTH